MVANRNQPTEGEKKAQFQNSTDIISRQIETKNYAEIKFITLYPFSVDDHEHSMQRFYWRCIH